MRCNEDKDVAEMFTSYAAQLQLELLLNRRYYE
jgi:hypothetical protein